MKSAIMQPYLFPYIGYFQLIHAVDTFVFHDDVQYIKGGWINRNRVLLNKEDYLYTFSLQSDSSSKSINERHFVPDIKLECDKFLRVLQTGYGNAPYFESTITMVKEVFNVMKLNEVGEDIAAKIARSVEYIAAFLELDCNFKTSSKIKKNEDTEGEDRVLEIARQLGAEVYINAIGGKDMYRQHNFKEENMDLLFLKSQQVAYPQFSKNFIPWLSIIDVCMFNDRDKIKELLASYSLVK